jgi:hypothetical protein
MPENPTSPVCIDEEPARTQATGSQLRYWHRRASAVELLIASGIIFVALVCIATSRGDGDRFGAPTLWLK